MKNSEIFKETPIFWPRDLRSKRLFLRRSRFYTYEIRRGKKNFCVFRTISSSNDNRKVRRQEVHDPVCILQYCKAIITTVDILQHCKAYKPGWTSCNVTAYSLRRTPMSVHLTGGKVARRSTANGHLARLPIKAARWPLVEILFCNVAGKEVRRSEWNVHLRNWRWLIMSVSQ